jgi:hypothetical protein
MSQPPNPIIRPSFSSLTGVDDLAAIEALTGAGIAARTGTNTWALRTLQQPAAGITITNPAGTAGDPTLVLANDLAALEGLSSTGMIARTGDGTAAVRTITAPAAGITVGNGDGVSGNPTLALANDLAALEGLASTGVIVRTGDGTATTRTITGTADRVTITDGSGVSGNPTADIASTYVGQTSITTLGTVATGTWNATTIGTSKGGTGLTGTPANGQLLIGNGSGYTLATLTDGSGITITEGAGTITIAATAASETTRNFLVNGGFAIRQRGTGGPGTITGNLTSGSASVSSVSSVALLSVGTGVAGSNIPAGTTVASIDSATAFTMSANATGTASTVSISTGQHDNTFSGADRWLFLSDGIQSNGWGDAVANGSFRVTPQSSGRYGLAQWLTNAQTIGLRGKTVLFSLKLFPSLTTTWRVAILEWTGTANTLGAGRDPVSDWTSGTFTTGNFFKSTTTTVVATANESLSAAGTVSCTGTVSSSANNLCVMAWSESATTAQVEFSEADLYIGSAERTFIHAPDAQDLAECERFYYKTFALGTQPVANAGAAGSNRFYTSYATGGYVTNFRQRMHRVPTLVVYNPGSASTGTFRNATDSTNLTAVPGTATDHGVVIGSAAATADKEYQFHLTADAEIA